MEIEIADLLKVLAPVASIIIAASAVLQTLAAWQQGAADTELMALEFAPLVKDRSAELEVLARVRDGLPVIAEFCKQQHKNGSIKVRSTLGIFRWPPWS
jgi:hypothetical protein